MNISQSGIIGKIRKAIDDIVPNGVTDSFVADADAELWQAVQHAAVELSQELPVDLLDVSIKSMTGTKNADRGSYSCNTENNFLRFISLDIAKTAGMVYDLIEAGSDAEKMQRSKWSRGTASKPKAMITHNQSGNKVLEWWPGGAENKNANLAYIAVPTEADNTITCAIRREAERLVIYRAASIFFEGKKEDGIAEKFRSMSTNY